MERDAIVVDDQGDQRYIVISADGHAGGSIGGYRPYLDREWLDEFDAWAATYEIPYEDLLGDKGERNWDSARRRSDLELDGQVAEVIFPNTVPPFFPKVALTSQPPALTAGDMDRRWAGLQAHNRWLADFCADAPGRRAGVAQITLYDIEASVAEVRRTHAAGLRAPARALRRGRARAAWRQMGASPRTMNNRLRTGTDKGNPTV